MIPSFFSSVVLIRVSTSLGTLQVTLWTALADKWDQMTDAFECMMAWITVRSELDVCDK